MRIAGIDPGTQLVGRAVIDLDRVSGLARVVDVGFWHLGKGTRVERLGRLADLAAAYLDELAPRVLVVELAHIGPHPGAGLAIAEARGVTLAIAHLGDVDVVQYRPAEIKQAITGKGNASKLAVARALVTRYGLDPALAEGDDFDPTDALALAVTHVPHVGGRS